jgi:predicted dehydrogenase
MTQPLRLGIIGTGVAARELHWPALKEMPDRFQVVALANRSRDKAEAFADVVGIEESAVYSNYCELLAREDVDVVDLALPPQLNYEVARAAADAGIHVICEKPIAVTLEEARAMLALPKEFGVQLLIAENFRYDGSVQKTRTLIDQGEVAPPFMMSYQYIQPVPLNDEISSRPWRQQPAHAGGCLSDHGVHMMDVARFLMGEVIEVQVFALDFSPHLVGMDTAVYNLKFRSGAIGSIQWSFAVASEQASLIQLWSDNATLSVKPDEVRLQRQGHPDEVYPISGPTSFQNEFEDFYETLVTGKKPLMTSQDALRDLEIILAAHRSAVANEVVVLGQGKKN